MILHNLFPTPVAKFELGREFTPEEIAFVTEQETHKNIGNSTSKNRYVLRDDAFKNILNFIQLSVSEYIETIYAPTETLSVNVTQSWLNYTKPGEFHHKHSHANSFISGVLYLKAAKERDRIYFYRDKYEQIKLNTNNFNLYNSESWWFEVTTGEMLLFPSSLQHMVETVKNEERISLSFNTFPFGSIGSEDNITALYLRD